MSNTASRIPIAIDNYYGRSAADLCAHELNIHSRLQRTAVAVARRVFTEVIIPDETRELLAKVAADTGNTFLLGPIHRDYVDTFANGVLVDETLPVPARYVARADMMSSTIGAYVVGHVGGIPIDRDNTQDPEIMSTLNDIVGHTLRVEHCPVVIYPEGERKEGLTVEELKKGTALLARDNNCPIVPIGIFGTQGYTNQLKHQRRRSKVVMVANPPIEAPTRRLGPATTELQHSMQNALTQARKIYYAAS